MGPDQAWAMRMDEALMLLAARTRLMERGQKRSERERAEAPPAVTTRSDGKKEVAIRSYSGLVSFLKQAKK